MTYETAQDVSADLEEALGYLQQAFDVLDGVGCRAHLLAHDVRAIMDDIETDKGRADQAIGRYERAEAEAERIAYERMVI